MAVPGKCRLSNEPARLNVTMASPQSSTRVFVTGPTRRRVAHGLLTALLLCAGPGFLTPSGLAPTAVGAEPVAAAALPS